MNKPIKNCMVIAELGTAHNGSLKQAKKLVDAAAQAGADCIKLQAVFADEIIHPASGYVDLPGGPVLLYERFKKLEMEPLFYSSIKEYTEKQGLTFLCTPFGIKSARLLRDMKISMLKIASPEINHFPLLKEVAGYDIPLILATGVSKLADIEQALEITGGNTTLLHCVTAYPARETEYNLKLIPHLRNIFGTPVGVSDHTMDPILVPTLAVSLGAVAVEKHLTLSKEGRGLDDPVALTPSQFETMVRWIRQAETQNSAETVESLAKTYSMATINQCLGNGIKQLAPGEKSSYQTTNRSIHALGDLPAGTALTLQNISLLRTEKNLKTGLPPRFLSVILGKKTTKAVENGQGITWDDLLRE